MEIDAVTIFRIQCAQIIWLVNTEWRLCLSLLPLCLKQAAKCGIQGWPFTVDLIYMQQCFNPELAICGRQLNQQLTTSLLRRPDFDDVGKMIKIVPAESTHKYIGPNLTAILYPRKIWNLFVVGGLSRTYCRLLGAYSPEQPHFVSFATTNSGLATLPLTMVCLQKLDHIRIFFWALGWAQSRDDQSCLDILMQMTHTITISDIVLTGQLGRDTIRSRHENRKPVPV